MTSNKFKYFAFISYNAKDVKWGKRLQRKLENYRMPATLCNEHGWKRTPIRPIFFAPTDIQPGSLTEELKERLRVSRNLIVICSPNSAKSEWVGREIEYFHSLGRTNNIYFFIVDGQPNSAHADTECFNPIVHKLGLPEILGVNIHEKIYSWPWLNKERAYVQLISKLLGIEFDAIWKRHRRLIIEKAIAGMLCVSCVMTIIIHVYNTYKPTDVCVKLKEISIHNDKLPPLKDAIITLELDNEIKRDTINSIGDDIIFKNIPSYFLGEEANVSFRCYDYNDIDTSIVLSKNVDIKISRNPNVYGNIVFRIWNPNAETFVSDAEIKIDGISMRTDSNGMYSLFIPLERQRAKYLIETSIPLESDTLYLPCINSTCLIMK